MGLWLQSLWTARIGFTIKIQYDTFYQTLFIKNTRHGAAVYKQSSHDQARSLEPFIGTHTLIAGYRTFPLQKTQLVKKLIADCQRCDWRLIDDTLRQGVDQLTPDNLNNFYKECHRLLNEETVENQHTKITVS